MDNGGVRPPPNDHIDGFIHILKALNRAGGNAVIHGNDNCFSGYSIDDTLNPDFLSDIHFAPSLLFTSFLRA
jgi:hypothetical protein